MQQRCPIHNRFLKKDGSCSKCTTGIAETINHPKSQEVKPMFTVNHSEAGGFEPITPGHYEAVISKTEVTTSKNSGAPMIKVTLTIRTDVDQEFAKRKLFDNLVIMENTMFKLQQVAKAVEIPEGTQIETPQQFAQAILFQPVRVKVKNEMYEGKVQDRVEFYDVATVPYSGSGDGGTTADPFANDGQPIDISDDDLPF